jgi:adhesin transport system membrane fusion protein
MSQNNQKFIDSASFSAYEKISFKANLLFFVIIIFLGIMLYWVWVSPIDEIVKGQGKIIPTLRIQNIQSVDGGTILKILVKEGDFVKKNQELLIIDDVRINSLLNELKNDLYSFKIQSIRLKAQSKIKTLKNIQKLSYSKDLEAKASDYIKNEKIYYQNKINELRSLINIQTAKYKQKKQEYNEIISKISKLRSSKKYIKKQLKITKQGVRDGVMSAIEELKLQKEYSNIKGDLAISTLALKRSKTSIKESKENIAQQIDIFKSKSSKELNMLQKEIKKIEAKLTLSNDKVKKSTIVASVDGIVNHIYFTTIGGVVKPADVLIDIVPTTNSLLVKTKINPKDIGFLSANNEVMVKITAYDFAIYGGLSGKIKQIGADSIFDEKTKSYYYQILVQTNKNYLGTKDKSLVIIPGMVAQVDIKTGKKTILQYLLKPITKTISNSMTER